MTPEVSVILPTRNRRALLSRALASALVQEQVSLEVIVVDDSSTDGTAEYLSSVADDRVRVVRLPVRSGVSTARNRGIKVARGHWLAFLDDDDRWLQRRLRATIDAALEVGADFAYGDTIVVNARGSLIELEQAPAPTEFACLLRYRSPIWGPSAVIARASLLERTGGFDQELAYLADWDLWFRMAAEGRAARCAEPLVEYTLHSGSMLFDSAIEVEREFARLAAKHPDIDRDHVLRFVADRYRAAGLLWRASRVYLREGVGKPDAKLLLRGVGVLFGERLMRIARRVRR